MIYLRIYLRFHKQTQPIKYYREETMQRENYFFLPYEHTGVYDSFSIKIYEINHI